MLQQWFLLIRLNNAYNIFACKCGRHDFSLATVNNNTSHAQPELAKRPHQQRSDSLSIAYLVILSY